MSIVNPSKRASFFSSYKDTRSLRSSANKSRHPDDKHGNSDSRDDTKLFGASLNDAVKLGSANIRLEYEEGIFLSLTTPYILKSCISFLVDHNCFEKEGVFRIGGALKKISKLQESFTADPMYNIEKSTIDMSVYEVATLLKRYLNGLPDSIFPSDSIKLIKQELDKAEYRDFLALAQNADELLSFNIDEKAPEVSDLLEKNLEAHKSPDLSVSSPISDDIELGKTPVLIIDVNPDNDPVSNVKDAEVVEENKNYEPQFKVPLMRPIPPQNPRKHSLLSVLSVDSALDGKMSSIDSLKALPPTTKHTIDSFLEFMAATVAPQLESTNLDVIIYIVMFLSHLSKPDNYDKTKMNSFNLSKIFQSSFFLNNNFISNVPGALGIEILNNNLKKSSSNTTTNTAGNRLSVSINTNNTYNTPSGNEANNRLSPTFTRGSTMSSNSGYSGLSSKIYGNSTSSVNHNNQNLTPGQHNFSLESFNSINVDYNVHQLVLKILIDNFDYYVSKLVKHLFKTGVHSSLFQDEQSKEIPADAAEVSDELKRKKTTSSSTLDQLQGTTTVQREAAFNEQNATDEKLSSTNASTDELAGSNGELKEKKQVKKKKLQSIFSFLHKNKKDKKQAKKRKERSTAASLATSIVTASSAPLENAESSDKVAASTDVFENLDLESAQADEPPTAEVESATDQPIEKERAPQISSTSTSPSTPVDDNDAGTEACKSPKEKSFPETVAPNGVIKVPGNVNIPSKIDLSTPPPRIQVDDTDTGLNVTPVAINLPEEITHEDSSVPLNTSTAESVVLTEVDSNPNVVEKKPQVDKALDNFKPPVPEKDFPSETSPAISSQISPTLSELPTEKITTTLHKPENSLNVSESSTIPEEKIGAVRSTGAETIEDIKEEEELAPVSISISKKDTGTSTVDSRAFQKKIKKRQSALGLLFFKHSKRAQTISSPESETFGLLNTTEYTPPSAPPKKRFGIFKRASTLKD